MTILDRAVLDRAVLDRVARDRIARDRIVGRAPDAVRPNGVSALGLAGVRPAPLAGQVRLLGESDRGLFVDHLLRLGPDGRRNRFSAAVSDEVIRAYAAGSFGPDAAVMAYVEDGLVRGASELRGIGLGVRGEAEAAFTVERAWRGRGVGTALFAAALDTARRRGVLRLVTTCLAQNRAMQALARKFEAELIFEAEDVLALVDADAGLPRAA